MHPYRTTEIVISAVIRWIWSVVEPARWSVNVWPGHNALCPGHTFTDHIMPRSHIHGSPRRFHYGSNPMDDRGNDNFRSPIRMHNASTTTYDYGCNTEIYGLIWITTDNAGSYPWLILRQNRECVTWALGLIQISFATITLSNQQTQSYWDRASLCICSYRQERGVSNLKFWY